MITVTYIVDGQQDTRRFPETRKGNSDSVKFIQQLHDERKDHVWYYKLTKIQTLKDKLENKRLGARTKKRYQLEAELSREEQDRNDILDLCGVTEAPPTIKILITHD